MVLETEGNFFKIEMLYPLNKTIMPYKKKKKTTEARRGKKNLGIILCICVDNSYENYIIVF